MKLTVQLKQPYKSFREGFRLEINGRLVILSGVNGGGKSQLLEIIQGREKQRPQVQIAADVALNGASLARDMIAYRSFKENISLPGFKAASPEVVTNSKNQVWNAYHRYRLDPSHQEAWNVQRACVKAKTILINEFGEENFKHNRITQQEVIECIALNNFIWETDDIFGNIVSEIFFRYATKILHAEAQAGRMGEKVDTENLGRAPWIELNDMFEKFGFDYRFGDNYHIPPGSHSLNKQPRLYAINKQQLLDESQARELNDLSDGEKSIISLVFGSLTGVSETPKQLLLFDEFDASLNPSLTKIFYAVVETYFLKKNVMVIIATHSPTTIALAPEGATFYEVFKPNVFEGRVMQVTRDSYSELQVANEHYVRSISDQSARIKILESTNTRLNNILSKRGLPIVYVEGPTDVDYIRRAYRLHGRSNDLEKFDVDIIGEVTITGTKSSNNAALKNAWSFLGSNLSLVDRKVVLLHDPESQVDESDRDGKLFRRRMPFTDVNPISVGIENLFGKGLIDRARAEKPDCFQYLVQGLEERNLRVMRKKDLCEWICANAKKDDFVGFEPLIAKIDAVIA